MRITPLDLQQKQFPKGFRGLNQDSVYSFIEVVREEFEELLQENYALKEKVQHLESSIHESKEFDSMIWTFISHAVTLKTGTGKGFYNGK